MKKLKNLTIISTLCISACIIAPTSTSAIMKFGQTSKPHSNFTTKKDYINFTKTGKKTPGSLVGSRLIIFGDGGTSTSTPSRQPLPSSTKHKKQVRFLDSSSSIPTTSNKSTSTQTTSSPKKGTVKERINYFEYIIKKNSDSSTKKSVSTQTKSTSDASTQTTTSLNKSTQTDPEKSNKATQTEPQVSKNKVSKLKKFFGN